MTITVTVSPGSGDTIPVEMNFPIDTLVDPTQLTAATVIPPFSSNNQQMNQQPQSIFQQDDNQQAYEEEEGGDIQQNIQQNDQPSNQQAFQTMQPNQFGNQTYTQYANQQSFTQYGSQQLSSNPPISSPMANILSGLSPDQTVSPIALVATSKSISPGHAQFPSQFQDSSPFPPAQPRGYLPSVAGILNQPDFVYEEEAVRMSGPVLQPFQQQRSFSQPGQSFQSQPQLGRNPASAPNPFTQYQSGAPVIKSPILQSGSIFSGRQTQFQNQVAQPATPQQSAQYVQSTMASIQSKPGTAVLRPFGTPIYVQQPTPTSQVQQPTPSVRKSPSATRLSELLLSPEFTSPRNLQTMTGRSPGSPPLDFGVLSSKTVISSQENEKDYLDAEEEEGAEEEATGEEESGAEEGQEEQASVEEAGEEEEAAVTQTNTAPIIQQTPPSRFSCNSNSGMIPAATSSPSCGIGIAEFQVVPSRASAVFTERPYVGGQTRMTPSNLLNNYPK